MRIAPLDRSSLPEVAALLDEACAFDRAGAVADEKLFGDGPLMPLQQSIASGAWRDGALVGVAAVSASCLRVLAVAPAVRRQGIGSALLGRCEQVARITGQERLSALDQPGNYLAPGIDERNIETIGWLERRGWQRAGEPRLNALIDVRGNPRVSAARAEELAAGAAARGYQVRRARRDEAELAAAIQAEFGGAWPFEVSRALGGDPPGVHVAVQSGAYCGFAAHDGNNRGLGWFGPTGTWLAHRGQGLGEALLMACLVDVAAHHAQCEVAWIGPRPFYDKVAGVAADRRFVVMRRALS